VVRRLLVQEVAREKAERATRAANDIGNRGGGSRGARAPLPLGAGM
jgi:hypothetical protein